MGGTCSCAVVRFSSAEATKAAPLLRPVFCSSEAFFRVELNDILNALILQIYVF